MNRKYVVIYFFCFNIIFDISIKIVDLIVEVVNVKYILVVEVI